MIADLFLPSRAGVTGYRKMLWTVGKLDGHASMRNGIPSEARPANEFRRHNPDIPIRAALFDVPITHYAQIERLRELAGALVAGLRWLAKHRGCTWVRTENRNQVWRPQRQRRLKYVDILSVRRREPGESF